MRLGNTNLGGHTMYALVRRYEGVDPGDIDQVVRQVDAGFVPILEHAHGFQG